jgi:hypothetical protein
MIVYNVTTMVNAGRTTEWLEWMRKVHIPELMSTGCFTGFRMMHLLEVDESQGVTYAVQYHCENREDYDRYTERFAPGMRKAAQDRWGDDALSFRTLMEVIN